MPPLSAEFLPRNRKSSAANRVVLYRCGRPQTAALRTVFFTMRKDNHHARQSFYSGPSRGALCNRPVLLRRKETAGAWKRHGRSAERVPRRNQGADRQELAPLREDVILLGLSLA